MACRPAPLLLVLGASALLSGVVAPLRLVYADPIEPPESIPAAPPLSPSALPASPVTTAPGRLLPEEPLRPRIGDRGTLPPGSFDASLDDLERDGVVTRSERMRVQRGRVAGPVDATRLEACRSGALSVRECSGVLQGMGQVGEGMLEGGGSASLRPDAAPLPPISVPVTALLAGAGGSFRLTDVFGRTPRPAPIAGNGNRSLLFPLIGSAVTSSGFGWRLHPLMGTWLMHTGKDLAAPEGTPVVAALNGRVVSSGLAGGYGLAIEVEHEGPRRRTLYGHLSELYVREGQTVRQGEVIGRVGSTGLSTGPHLHFEVRLPQLGGWVAVDPGELDPGGLFAAGGGTTTPVPDAVALLVGQLVQSLERPSGPPARSSAAAAAAWPPHQQLPAPNPLPLPNNKG
jgi:murein DD-endopeptidase MepM/ murein hydrolase activator NlpD